MVQFRENESMWALHRIVVEMETGSVKNPSERKVIDAFGGYEKIQQTAESLYEKPDVMDDLEQDLPIDYNAKVIINWDIIPATKKNRGLRLLVTAIEQYTHTRQANEIFDPSDTAATMNSIQDQIEYLVQELSQRWPEANTYHSNTGFSAIEPAPKREELTLYYTST